MGKTKREKNYEAVSEAKLRFARMSARKARLVCDLVRGKRLGEALSMLRFTYKPSAQPDVLRLLKSARANAERQKVGEVDELVITDIFVDNAPMIKRMRPAPMGRGVRVRKRMCHITVRLNQE
jgi:large subunit ribosomal protein L22